MTRTHVALALTGSLVLFACSSGHDSDGSNTAKDDGGAKSDAGGAGSKSMAMHAKDAGTAAGGSGGSTASGNTGGGNVDAGPGIHDGPFEPSGEAISADDGKWTWIPMPDTQCRDGSMAGAAISLKSKSKKLMIYLEGGGACFDALTCLGNPASVAGQTDEQTAGVFDRGNAANPVKDWNWVYVPYCTGDVHSGTNDNGMVSGVGAQHFVGRRNLEAVLNRVVPTFPDLDQVLLTGISAGGFGATANVELVQWAFGDVPVTMIDDSGPPMSPKYLPSCLQKQWRETWGLDASLLADCGDDCPNHDDYEVDFTKHLAKTFPDHMGGLIDSMADGTITAFYGYGLNDCTGNILTPVPADMYGAGLLDYREIVKSEYPNFGTFYIPGTQHTWLGTNLFYSCKAGDAMLVDWFANILNGVEATHEGP